MKSRLLLDFGSVVNAMDFQAENPGFSPDVTDTSHMW